MTLQTATHQSGENVAMLEDMVAKTKMEHGQGNIAGSAQHGAEIDTLTPLMQELIALVHQRLSE